MNVRCDGRSSRGHIKTSKLVLASIARHCVFDKRDNFSTDYIFRIGLWYPLHTRCKVWLPRLIWASISSRQIGLMKMCTYLGLSTTRAQLVPNKGEHAQYAAPWLWISLFGERIDSSESSFAILLPSSIIVRRCSLRGSVHDTISSVHAHKYLHNQAITTSSTCRRVGSTSINNNLELCMPCLSLGLSLSLIRCWFPWLL